MTVSWKSWPTLIHTCLLLCATGGSVVSQKFQLQPENASVLLGSDARFLAHIEGSWDVMTWKVKKSLVLTVFPPRNISSSLPRFSARFCFAGNNSCVEFTIHNVVRRDTGPVVCEVQGVDGSRTAQLHVQESGEVNIMVGNMTVLQDQQVEFQCVATAWFPTPTVSWTRDGQAVDSGLTDSTSMADGDLFNSTSVLRFQAVRNTKVACLASVPELTNPKSSSVFLVVVPKPPDWTVLIAVVLSFGGFALVVLLILGILFCYKRRKEKQSNYQDEMSRRVRTQSQLSVVSGTGQGVENPGFVPEGQMSVTPSDHSYSGFSQENGYNLNNMPDVVSGNQEGNAYINVGQSGFRKHRHVTIV